MNKPGDVNEDFGAFKGHHEAQPRLLHVPRSLQPGGGGEAGVSRVPIWAEEWAAPLPPTPFLWGDAAGPEHQKVQMW